METMKYDPVGWLLDQQIEFFRGRGVSLHSLWRAAGQPVGRHPRRWVTRAGPLIAGLTRYIEAIAGEAGDADGPRPVLWEWDGEDGEPWCVGDLMAHEVLARLYAEHLESRK